MRVRFVCFVIIFFRALVLVTGCGEEDITEPEAEMDESEEGMVELEDPCLQKGPPNTGQLTVTPAPGGIISSTQEFTLIFDMVVVEVTVNGVAATDTKASGLSSVWVVSLILEPGTRSFAVEWTESDGCTGAQAMGPYTVVADED